MAVTGGVAAVLTLLVTYQMWRKDDAGERAAVEAEDRRTLDALRANVAAEVDERIAGSLFNEVRIALGREREPDAVATPWARELESPERPAEPVPAACSTADVFDASPGQILILGDPGAGKTVELLHLARDLLARAGPDDPVPVLLNLSSFDDPALTLNDWLVRELKRRFLVGAETGARLVAGQRLLLLDGLDEIAAPRPAACASAA
jgi:hypothetical protein